MNNDRSQVIGAPAFAVLILSVLVAACIATFSNIQNDTPAHEWWDERGPVVPHESFPADCALCHSGEGWHEIRADFTFDHAAETGTELLGSHRTAECLRCHNDKGPIEVFAARGCAGCHEDIHRADFGKDCSSCHTEDNWRADDRVLQHQNTRFPLVGAHVAAACWSCHPGSASGMFQGADIACESCHADDLARANDPDHLASGFVTGCDRCHIPTSWTGAAFNHPGFQLTGGHAGLDCTECHIGPGFSGATTDCFSCHMDDFATASNPDHNAAALPTNCEACHGTSNWFGAKYAHTSWAQTGAHLGANCLDCHAGNIYQGTPSECSDCHLAEYTATTAPNHIASGFPITCDVCHGTSTWLGANFAHSTWPLTGAHIAANCTDCHVGNVYAGTPSNCVDCHLSEYTATTSPNHTMTGFPTNCEDCHSTTSWLGASFNHMFPINSGAHSSLNCIDCHTVPSNFAMFACIECHEHNESDMLKKHTEVGGYAWQTAACYSCHPDGTH